MKIIKKDGNYISYNEGKDLKGFTCAECDTTYEWEPRVEANMKCASCAYNGGGNGGYVSKADMEQAEALAELSKEE